MGRRRLRSFARGASMRRMEQSGEQRIAAPRERVWAALNDPEVLKRCIEGCERLELTAPDKFEATVRVKVGPLSAAFTGEVTLKDVKAPESQTLDVSAKGGAAGFARGEAFVTLAEDGPGATLLTYRAEGRVGGKLAQIGQRLIDAAARKTAEDFFAAFSAEVAPPADLPVAEGGPVPALARAPAPAWRRWALGGGGIALGAAIALLAWRLMSG